MSIEQGSEVTESTVAPEAPASPAPETPSAPDVGKIAGAAAHGGEPAAAPFVPKTEFMVRGQKKTVDEWMLPIIKDEATQKKVIELYEKAHGIDHVKSERKQYQEELTETRSSFEKLNRQVDRVTGYLQNNDFASFQRELNIPNEMILLRAKAILDMRDNPHLAAAEDNAYQGNQRQVELAEENERLQQGYMRTVVAQRTQELNLAMQRPDVSSVSQAFDARAGRPGAFMDEVVKRGQFYAHQGVDKGVDEVLGEILQILGGTQPQAPAAIAPLAPAAAAPQTPVVAPKEKPVIPNLQGRGGSPVQKTIGSLKELREVAREKLMADAQ
jgi:hypothetical protein